MEDGGAIQDMSKAESKMQQESRVAESYGEGLKWEYQKI